MLARNAGVALSGVLVERMVEGAVAELLVGVKRDPAFGPVVVVGAGGGLVELIGDARPLLAAGHPRRRRGGAAAACACGRGSRAATWRRRSTPCSRSLAWRRMWSSWT